MQYFGGRSIDVLCGDHAELCPAGRSNHAQRRDKAEMGVNDALDDLVSGVVAATRLLQLLTSRSPVIFQSTFERLELN